MTGQVAAVSCGLVGGEAVLDLDYAEDSGAEADANFVLTEGGGIVEIQGTAERDPFTEPQFLSLMGLARAGTERAIRAAARGARVMARRLERGSRLVMATPQSGQAARDAALLAPHAMEAVSAGELGLPEPEEDAPDFAGNARIKALAARERGHPGAGGRFRLLRGRTRRRAGRALGPLGRTRQRLPPAHAACA